MQRHKFENFSEETGNYLKWKRLEKIKQILELRNIRNCSTCALLTMPKPLTVWITTNGGEFFKRWEYQTTWPASWEICMQVKKQQLFIFISWRLITLQYCSGFCHTLTWISHGFTCIPHPDSASHLPLHPIPLGLPSAPGPSTCLMHPTWAGNLFHHR